MPVVVQKYGGSSVADVEKLGRVADKVAMAKRAGDDVVVVVSAMGKTTDQLLSLAKQIDESPPRRELDMLLTTGERVSMALLSMAIQKRGLAAISFTGSQSGIITNDRHFDARIIEVKPYRIEDELARGRVVIVAGYQGMSYKREITTLGRGGSDTTAVALAAALRAERVEIYSDVDGVYTADPRVVPEARHLPEVGYETMQEMADAGAKVLSSGAIEHAQRARLTIHARATFAPGRETRVCEGVDGERAIGVVGQRGCVRLVARDEDTLHRALAITSEASVPVRDVERTSALAATALTPDWALVRARLTDALGDALALEPARAAASVVGPRDLVSADRLRDTLVSAGLAPTHVVDGRRSSALIEEASLDDAVRALHAAFVGP